MVAVWRAAIVGMLKMTLFIVSVWVSTVKHQQFICDCSVNSLQGFLI